MYTRTLRTRLDNFEQTRFRAWIDELLNAGVKDLKIGHQTNSPRLRSGGARMSDVTGILSAIEQGDPQAAEQLLPLVYGALRRLAARRLEREAPGQTLSPTALVHEAYLRLVDTAKVQQWNSRGHFFRRGGRSDASHSRRARPA